MSILHDLVEEDTTAGYPNQAVLVVRKQTGRCGAGFFRDAAVNGFDVSDQEAYWLDAFERVCDYWSEM